MIDMKVKDFAQFLPVESNTYNVRLYPEQKTVACSITVEELIKDYGNYNVLLVLSSYDPFVMTVSIMEANHE